MSVKGGGTALHEEHGARGPAPAPHRSREEGDTVVRGTVLAFLAKLAGGVFTGGLTIFLARTLGSHSYGVLALALSIVALLELVSDFGVAVAIPRFLAEERADGDSVRRLVADGLLLEAAGSVLFGGALLALAGVFAAAYHAPALAMPLRALAVAMIGTKFLFFSLGVFAALRRQALNVWASLIESVAEAFATVTLVVIAGGATAAAFGKATGYAIGAVAGLLLVRRLLGGGITPRLRSSRGNVRRILGYAANVWIVDGVYTAFMQIDSLLIGAMIAAGSVAFFQAPMRLILLLQYPGAAIAAAVAPRMAISQRSPRNTAAFASSLRLLVLLMVPATVFTTVWATTIVHYALGPGYGRAADVLRVLAPYVFLSGGATLVSTSLNFLGRARSRIPIAIATLLVNVLLDALLIPRIGVVGGAVGSDAGLAIYVLAHLWLCASLMGLRVRPLVATLARCLLAAVPVALLLASVGTGQVSPLAAVLGATAATSLYVLGLVAVGELAPGEISLVIAGLRRRLGLAPVWPRG